MDNFMDKRRIVLLDADVKFLDLLSTLIRYQKEVRLINQYIRPKDLLKNIKKDHPDIIIADLDYFTEPKLDLISEIRSNSFRVEIVLITDTFQNESVLNLFTAGATGLLLKSNALAEMPNAIATIIKGGSPIDPYVVRIILNSMQASPETILSSQECKVLKLLSKGISTRFIGKELGISIDTVRSHLKNIYKKLKVNSKMEALRKAKEERLLPSMSFSPVLQADSVIQ